MYIYIYMYIHLCIYLSICICMCRSIYLFINNPCLTPPIPRAQLTTRLRPSYLLYR